MSLPSRLGITDLSKFSAPYLKAPRQKTHSPIQTDHNTRAFRRIGFVWRGNPRHKNDLRRSMPILNFANYLPSDHANWISLQVGGDVTAELNLLRCHLNTLEATTPSIKPDPSNLPKIDDAGSQLNDFFDTAQAITATDQLITVDTAVAHLGAAIGFSTTILVPDPPDWRWGIKRDISVWSTQIAITRF
jgi:hypothetical protein